ERHQIESELILVDWNPPRDKALLKDVIRWPSLLKYCTIRVIEVDPSIHQRYQYHNKIPVHATVAVNCGIRRSRGEFILPGTIDLLYSNELMSFIASKVLKPGERYRVDRCDVVREVLKLDALREQLDYCGKNVIQVHSSQPYFEDGLPGLHTNACGDFQLMSRHFWCLLRGYTEDNIAPAHPDSLLSYASYAAGVKEVVLCDPIRLYHIDHDGKFNDRLKSHPPFFEAWASSRFIPRPLSEKLIALYRRIFGDETRVELDGVPTLSFSEYRKICKGIVAGKRSYIFNDETWGLGEERLEETLIAVAESDKGLLQSQVPTKESLVAGR
ncbi:MAG TPA: hypothetical protein VJ044_02880, partial [Candidatus Hodarchaeales archaeon]|nr:hypothetical protein [Candidatus Hodarchaeales archaeon]